MLVSEYINLLVSGEIKPLSVANIGGEHRDEIQQDNVTTLIGFINLANAALHEKFALIQKEFILDNLENNKTYELPSDYIYPVSAALEDGTQISLNNERKMLVSDVDKNLSIMFPEPFVCLVKGEDVNDQTKASLIYVASPELVKDPKDTVKLTSAFTQAILDYVAYKSYVSVNGNIDATNNTYYMRYIADCNLIKSSGLSAEDNLDSNFKLEERGYV